MGQQNETMERLQTVRELYDAIEQLKAAHAREIPVVRSLVAALRERWRGFPPPDVEELLEEAERVFDVVGLWREEQEK